MPQLIVISVIACLLAGCSIPPLIGEMKPGAAAVFSPALEVAFPENDENVRIIRLAADVGNNRSFLQWFDSNAVFFLKGTDQNSAYKLFLANEAFRFWKKEGDPLPGIIIGADFLAGKNYTGKHGDWFFDLRSYRYTSDGSLFLFSTTEAGKLGRKQISRENILSGDPENWRKAYGIAKNAWIDATLNSSSLSNPR